MAKRLNDDLFEGTTMSFGEHLEELRKSLFKAMFGLVIGALLGLLVANWIVQTIQSPLSRALTNFYVDKAVSDLEAKYPGEVPPEMVAFISREKVVFDEQYFERKMLAKMAQGGEAPSQPAKNGTSADKNLDDGSGAPVEQDPSEKLPGKVTDDQADQPLSAAVEKSDAGGVAPVSRSTWQSLFDYFKIGPQALETEAETALSKIASEKLPPPDADLVKTRVWRPLDIRITALSAQEVFMIWLKASLIAGCVISSPYIFYQIWNFVAAGLYPHEKNYVYLYLPFSLGLFLAGSALAFFFVFDPVLEFLFKFNKSMGIDPDPRINEWLSFVLYLPLGFGVSFQLPLVMLFLNRIGLFSIEIYLSKWRIAILTIFVISMVLTPADPISMLLMAIPLTFLYFFGVGLCRWMPRGRNPFDAAYEP